MDAEEFRARGHELIDWIADHVERVAERPVAPAVQPGDVRSRLPAHPPAAPEPWEAVRRDLDEIIVPGLVEWQHPRFFAYFPSNVSYPSILGELLSAGLGVQGMSWVTSPACTELETLMLDWMAELLDLPDRVPLDERDRRRCHPGLGQRGHARGHPRGAAPGDGGGGQPRRRHDPARRLRHRRRPTRASRRGCGSPASAPIGCASCRTIATSGWTPPRWRR